MMGLLGDSWDDPKTQAALNLAAGLLSGGNFGQAMGRGLLGYQESMGKAQEAAYKKEQMDMVRAKTALENAALQKQQRMQEFLMGKFGVGAQAGAQAGGDPGQADPGAPMPPAAGAIPQPPQPQGQSPMPMAGGNGRFPLSLNETALLKALGGPDLIEAYKTSRPDMQVSNGYAYDKNEVRPGFLPSLNHSQDGKTTVNVIGPNGMPITMAAPGSLATFRAFEDAKNRSQAGLDLIEVPMPDGSKRMMPRSQAAQLLGGSGGGGAAGQPGGLGMAQSPSDRTYQDENAKASAEMFKQIQNAGFRAPGQIAKYQQLASLLEQHDGGRLSNIGLELSKLGNSMGLNIDKSLGNKEAAQALHNELALALRDPSSGGGMPGAMSDSDRAFLSSMVPSLSNSAAGRKTMIDMSVKTLQRQSDVAMMARKWQQRYGRLDAVNPSTGRSFQDNLQLWADQNPLFPQQ